MHIALLAPEFPPAVGGMCAYAIGMAAQLARSDTLTVYTLEGRGDPSLPFEQKPILSRDLDLTARRLRHERADVWYSLNAGLVAVAPALRGPVAATFHGNDFMNPWLTHSRPWLEPLTRRPWRWRWRARRLQQALNRRAVDRGLGAVARVFAVSTASARLLGEIYPRHRHRVRVVPPGVDDIFFEQALPDARGCDGAQPLRLLTVSRLETWTKRKNVDGVLRALAALPPALRVEYTIVGDGDDRPRLEHLAAELGVADRVRFAGRASREELMRLYRASDLFVLAARARENDVEGFGIVYVEAAAMGLPAICSREGGATDAVEDGLTGLVLDSSAPESIAAAIVRFAGIRGRFDPATLRAFADRFRWHRIAATIRADLYAIAGTAGAPGGARAPRAVESG